MQYYIIEQKLEIAVADVVIRLLDTARQTFFATEIAQGQHKRNEKQKQYNAYLHSIWKSHLWSTFTYS